MPKYKIDNTHLSNQMLLMVTFQKDPLLESSLHNKTQCFFSAPPPINDPVKTVIILNLIACSYF